MHGLRGRRAGRLAPEREKHRHRERDREDRHEHTSAALPGCHVIDE